MQDLPDTLCYLNGEFCRCAGQGLGARPRLHLRRRHLRGRAGLRRQAVPLRRAHGAAGTQPGQAAHRQSAGPRRVACALRAGWSTRWQNATGAPDQLVYIQVTRGVAPRDHVMPSGIEPTVFMMANPMKPPTRRAAPPGRGLRHGARLPLGARRHQEHLAARQRAGAADLGRPRRARDDHVPRRLPHRGGGAATSGSCTKARCSARRRASMCSKASATSCSASCARRTASPSTCGRSPRPRSRRADEVLLSSATKEVLPVTLLDGEPVGHGALRGKPGPVYARLYEAYQRAKSVQSI